MLDYQYRRTARFGLLDCGKDRSLGVCGRIANDVVTLQLPMSASCRNHVDELTVIKLKPSSSAKDRIKLCLPDPLAPLTRTESCNALARVTFVKQDDIRSRSFVAAVWLKAVGATSGISYR